MDEVLSVKTEDFADKLREYALADDSRRPGLLGIIQNMLAQPHKGDYTRDIIHALCKIEWKSPSPAAKKFLADVMFQELDAVEGKTTAPFEELYEVYILLRYRLSYRGVSTFVRGFRNNRMSDGLLEQVFNATHPAIQIQALEKAVLLPGAEVNDLLAFLATMPAEEVGVSTERSIGLAKHYLDNRVSVSRDMFLGLLGKPAPAPKSRSEVVAHHR